MWTEAYAKALGKEETFSLERLENRIISWFYLELGLKPIGSNRLIQFKRERGCVIAGEILREHTRRGDLFYFLVSITGYDEDKVNEVLEQRKKSYSEYGFTRVSDLSGKSNSRFEKIYDAVDSFYLKIEAAKEVGLVTKVGKGRR